MICCACPWGYPKPPGCQFSGHWPPSKANPPKVAASPMRAQQNFVIEVPTPGNGTALVWTGDRWQQAPDGVKGHEGQFWAPLRFAADGTLRDVAWLDSFDVAVPS